ncbi:MAG: hypothetical protein RLZZ519_3016 [Bacteroidota bacterium]|jgi:hypothetical protein
MKGIVREPEGVEFTVINRDMTEKERQLLSAYIAKDKLRMAKLKKRRETAAAKRAALKAAKANEG